MQSLYSGCEMQVFVDLTVKSARGNALATLSLCLLIAGCLSGCSLMAAPSRSDKAWLLDGSLALSRPVPPPSKLLAAAPLEVASDTPRASLKASSTENSNAASIVISRNDKTLTAMRPGESPLVLRTEGAQHLKAGSFSITQKQEDPLWYAPNRYFTKRSLSVPPEGSRERFKRAALGSRTLFLNDQTPIHSGPVWMQEIGGLQVKPSEMAQIYSMIAIGTRVEVR
jgi:hypothetical protein